MAYTLEHKYSMTHHTICTKINAAESLKKNIKNNPAPLTHPETVHTRGNPIMYHILFVARLAKSIY
jgi:hypothetical protein